MRFESEHGVTRDSGRSPFGLRLRTTRFATTVIVGLMLACAGPSAAGDVAWQSPDSIRGVAEDYVRARVGGDESTQVESGGIDDRLRLAACEGDLAARMHGNLNGGRGTVAVSCPGPTKWQLYVPVQVFQMVDVAVADRTIAAGEIIGGEAVRLERRASIGLPHLYARGLDGVVGQRARHTITAGNVIQMPALNVTRAVERGALVTLTSRRAGISVHGEGEAIEAGAVGEKIRIRTPAGRVVEGTIMSGTEVRVGG